MLAFTQLEQDKQRGDINEGTTNTWLFAGSILSMKGENGELKKVDSNTDGIVSERSQNLEFVNLYCMFYLQLPVIYNTSGFLNRLELSVKTRVIK